MLQQIRLCAWRGLSTHLSAVCELQEKGKVIFTLGSSTSKSASSALPGVKVTHVLLALFSRPQGPAPSVTGFLCSQRPRPYCISPCGLSFCSHDKLNFCLLSSSCPTRPTPSTGCHEYCYLPYDLLCPEVPPRSILGATSELSTRQMQSRAFHKPGVLHIPLRLTGNLKSIYQYFPISTQRDTPMSVWVNKTITLKNSLAQADSLAH